jgi:hypothetical protein
MSSKRDTSALVRSTAFARVGATALASRIGAAGGNLNPGVEDPTHEGHHS